MLRKIEKMIRDEYSGDKNPNPERLAAAIVAHGKWAGLHLPNRSGK